MTSLRIYFSTRWRDGGSDCSWALLDDAGALIQSGCDPLASMPAAQECVGVVAAERTLCLEVDRPAGSRRRWLRALPYLAEPYTLPDPEENHVVPGPLLNNGRMLLYVVDKSWLRLLTEACRSANLSLRRVVPEIALPAVEAESWTLVWNGQGGFLCTAPMQGVQLDADLEQRPPLALQFLLSDRQSQLRQINWRFLGDLPPERRILPEWDGLTPAPKLGKDWDWRLAPIPQNAPNLLWGEMAPPLRPLEWWPRLRPAAVLLLIILVIEVAGSNLQWGMLSYEKRSLTSGMEQSFRQVFGNEAVLVNAPLQMQRHLADLRHGAGLQDGGDFLPLLDRAAGALAGLPAGSVRSLHYTAGRLDLVVRLDTPSAVTALRNKLHDLGMGVRADVHDTGAGTEVRLTLQQSAEI